MSCLSTLISLLCTTLIQTESVHSFCINLWTNNGHPFVSYKVSGTADNSSLITGNCVDLTRTQHGWSENRPCTMVHFPENSNSLKIHVEKDNSKVNIGQKYVGKSDFNFAIGEDSEISLCTDSYFILSYSKSSGIPNISMASNSKFQLANGSKLTVLNECGRTDFEIPAKSFASVNNSGITLLSSCDNNGNKSLNASLRPGSTLKMTQSTLHIQDSMLRATEYIGSLTMDQCDIALWKGSELQLANQETMPGFVECRNASLYLNDHGSLSLQDLSNLRLAHSFLDIAYGSFVHMRDSCRMQVSHANVTIAAKSRLFLMSLVWLQIVGPNATVTIEDGSSLSLDDQSMLLVRQKHCKSCRYARLHLQLSDIYTGWKSAIRIYGRAQVLSGSSIHVGHRCHIWISSDADFIMDSDSVLRISGSSSAMMVYGSFTLVDRSNLRFRGHGTTFTLNENSHLSMKNSRVVIGSNARITFQQDSNAVIEESTVDLMEFSEVTLKGKGSLKLRNNATLKLHPRARLTVESLSELYLYDLTLEIEKAGHLIISKENNMILRESMKVKNQTTVVM